MEHGGEERDSWRDERTVCELAIIFRRVERWNTMTRENQVTDVGYCRFQLCHQIERRCPTLLHPPFTIFTPHGPTCLTFDTL